MHPISYGPNKALHGGIGRSGFTLVEIILVLVLMGIAGAFATVGISELADGYVFTRENTQTAGKAQLAMLRISKELVALKSVTSASASSIRFTTLHGSGVTKDYTLSADGAGNLILYDNGAGGPATEDILTNQVSAFALAYYDSFNGAAQTTWSGGRKEIGFTLALVGANGVSSTFSSRVTPRNL